MPFTAMTKPSVGEATKKSSFADLTIDNLVYLNSMIGATAAGGSLIANGSFEADVDTDGIPDGWAIEEYTAGAFARDITTPGHGAVAIKFTSPGATGGGEISSALFPVSPRVPIIIDFLTKSSVAGIHNQLLVSWYTTSNLADYIETTTLWDKDTSNPSAWKRYQFVACAPATGLWACVTLVGAKNDNATAGVAYFDGVTVTAGLPAIGWWRSRG